MHHNKHNKYAMNAKHEYASIMHKTNKSSKHALIPIEIENKLSRHALDTN